jgi:hypothetical protein
MDAKTIAGAGLIIGGGMVGYKAMQNLSGLGCYGPAAYLTLGLTGVGAGLWMFGKLRQDAMKKKGKEVKEQITAVMGSEYYPWLPEGMDAGAIVVPNIYGDTSSAAGMPQGSGRGVPQWYGSAEGRKYGKRDRYQDRWGNARYFTRRKDGSIVTSVNIAGKRGAVANDRRRGALNYAKAGYRQMGDAKPVTGMERIFKDAEHMDEAGLPVIPDSYGTNSALSSGYGVPVWYGSAEGKGRYGRRQRFTTSKGNQRYVARNTKGEFISNVSVAGKRGSIAQDMRRKAKSYAPQNYRQMGDAKRVSRQERTSKNE